MKKIMLVAVVFTLLFSLIPLKYGHAQQSEPIVNVKLVNYLGNKTQLSLKPTGDYIINGSDLSLSSQNTYLLKTENGRLSLYKDNLLLNSFDTFSVTPVQAEGQLFINDRGYLGSFKFVVENNQFVRPINSVKMENYLKGVVPIEMYPSWEIEALKTQAVAARTYAMGYLNSDVINDTISYQVYGGYVWTTNTSKAVDATQGQVAQYNGRLIDAVYSASNGGMTESNANAWGNTAVPYLTIKPDSYDPKKVWNFSLHQTQIDLTTKDLANPTSWWTETNEADATITTNIKMWLNKNGYANKDIKIVSIPEFSLSGIASGGRVSKGNVTLEFFVKDKMDADGKLALQHVSLSNLSASTIRNMIGGRVMLSLLVDSVNTENNLITVKGFGDGHGVGMSQWGAQNMAKAGKSYEDILKFYYTGISIVKIYDVSHSTPQTPIQQQHGWVYTNGKWSYFNSTGSKATGWLKDANQWYYLNQYGEMLTGWQMAGGKWYFLKSNGAMATGWLKDQNKWYFLTSSGAMATGWLKDQNKWYFLTSSGAMATGWIFVQGKWYYLSGSGAMVTGWQKVGSKSYLFHSSGYWIR
ncbi:SpoIID/LytB domain-containing protein [Bacillus sp. S3]|uniref:SpoIID/LytB domain-containing protein n=1 Tax=Bacillus sp. S3 TaxID=486398 RepID=UPI00118984E7|nr:SpoIID/LytB domain-containing protein [Bacillus sp. S3]QCJ42681.1 SpoIID/LytB domain-containing protein [Bacillus sp. S3]